MKYSKCESSNNLKNGHIYGLQRYKCKDFRRSFRVEKKSTSNQEDVKRQAFLMYLERLGFSYIGRILRVSHVSVLNWIRKYGRDVFLLRNYNPVPTMELYELHPYVGYKKTIVGIGLALVETTGNMLISSWVTEEPKQV